MGTRSLDIILVPAGLWLFLVLISAETDDCSPSTMPGELGGDYVTWCDASHGRVPDCAVANGNDDGPLYIGRAVHENGLLPGTVDPRRGACFVANYNAEHRKSYYQVLCGYGLEWAHTRYNNIPKNAVQGGAGPDGQILYIGRTYHRDKLIIGKVVPSLRCLYIPYRGEVSFFNYEILVQHRNTTGCQQNWNRMQC